MKKKLCLFIGVFLLALVGCDNNTVSTIPSETEKTDSPRYSDVSIVESTVTEGTIDLFVKALDLEAVIYYQILPENKMVEDAKEIKETNSLAVDQGFQTGLLYKSVSGLDEAATYEVFVAIEKESSFSQLYHTTVKTKTKIEVMDRGDGTLEKPYKIATVEELEDVASDSDKISAHYILENDIDLADKYGEGKANFVPLGTQSGSIKAFSGSFNGKGFTIKNLYISTKNESTGLFGQLAKDGVISDLVLENPYVTSNGQRLGSVCGYSKGTIANIAVHGGMVKSVGSSTAKAGGVIGEIYEFGTAVKIYSNITVEAEGQNVGGVIGSCDSPNGSTAPIEIKECYSVGSVVGAKYVGGVIGYSRCMNITSCYSTAKVTGTEGVGGVVGFAQQRSGSPVIPNLISCFSLNQEVKATGVATSNSSGPVAGNISSSNLGVVHNKLFTCGTTVETPKLIAASTYSKVEKEVYKDATWLNNNMGIIIGSGWILEDGFERPILQIAVGLDNGLGGTK